MAGTWLPGSLEGRCQIWSCPLARVPRFLHWLCAARTCLGVNPSTDRRTAFNRPFFPFPLGRRPKFQLQPSIRPNGGGIPGCSADLEGNETASRGLKRSRLSKGCELTRKGCHPRTRKSPIGSPLVYREWWICWATPSCFLWTLWTEMCMGGVGRPAVDSRS